jgi:hypothetical protein
MCSRPRQGSDARRTAVTARRRHDCDGVVWWHPAPSGRRSGSLVPQIQTEVKAMNQMSPRICKRVKILAQHRFRTAWRSTGSMACPPVTQLPAWEAADLAAVVASATATDPSGTTRGRDGADGAPAAQPETEVRSPRPAEIVEVVPGRGSRGGWASCGCCGLRPHDAHHSWEVSVPGSPPLRGVS